MKPLSTTRRVICPYCQQDARLVLGEEIHLGKTDQATKPFWWCAPCDAFIGCYPKANGRSGRGDGTMPLGRLANYELREAKKRLHRAFDPLFKKFGIGHYQAYEWLSEQLAIPHAQCQISLLTLEQCQQATQICNDYAITLKGR